MSNPRPYLLSLVLLGTPAGLALRHDVDESRYLELGAGFPAVVQVSGLGSGTLITPDWVLTAAHVPEMIQRMRPDDPLRVSFEGGERIVARVVYPEERAGELLLHDIALLRLAEPVTAIEPLALHVDDVEPELEFVLAGWGTLAQGDEGVEMSAAAMASPTRRLRAGTNAITRVDPLEALFFATFDDPDTALELEAAPCIGDSGGAALVEVPGAGEEPATWRVAGVIAQMEDVDEDGVICEYGEEFGMTLVAAYLDWIEETIGE